MGKRVIDELHLTHIAAVNHPCQEGALARTIKSRADLVAVIKEIDLPVARGFAEVMEANEAWKRRWEVQDKLWPVFDAIRESLVSIAADQGMDESTKLSRSEQSVTEFIEALRAQWPEVASEFEKNAEALSKSSVDVAAIIKGMVPSEETDMNELEKARADLAEAITAKNAAIAERDAAVAKLRETETAKAKAEGEKEKLTGELEGLKKSNADLLAKHDETFTLSGTTTVVKSSEVGATNFAIMKAQEDRVIKAETEGRVEKEFPHVAGTTAEKSALLMHLRGAPEAILKTAETIFTAAEKMTAGAFQTLGGRGEQIEKAAGDFMTEVTKLQTDEKLSKSVAMERVGKARPDLLKAYQEAGQAN
jgi:hypothetical protein